MTLAYQPPKRDVRITPEQYFYLCQTNVLEGRTELINGKIIRMTSQYDQHAWAVTQVAKWAFKAFPEKSNWVRVQMTLHCGNDVPEPDLAVISGKGKPSKTYMTAERAQLVVEVADATMLADLRVKPAIYATVGIPEYWVVDVKNRRLVVHRGPRPGTDVGRKAAYLSIETFAAHQAVAPLSAPKKPLKIVTLFAP